MIIGIPKEIMPGEDRVSSSPATVAQMVKDGLTVLVEKGAGDGAFYHDDAYMEAGAEVVSSAQELYDRSDVILKVKEPLFNHDVNKSEVDMMHKGQLLITFIHPAAPANHKMVQELANAGINSLAIEGVPRISRAQKMDALTSMSTCAGYKGILLAVNALPKFAPQMFTAVGMIKPINVLVIGTGVGGLQALATARRLGAKTFAVDIRPAAMENAQSLGATVIDVEVPPEEAIGKGGYALTLSEERLRQEREILAQHIKDMDIVFSSALVPGELAPILITEDMVKTMKPGSVIVDISIDQGGNCEITPPGTVEVKHGVHCFGIKNIPGLLPESATWLYAQNIYALLKYLIKDGEIVLDRDDEIIKDALTTYNGELVHEGTLKAIEKLGH
ncbi:MAG: NAD(P) transhydrogenase subunit alpha [Saccharofermentanales bacterium]|jgi:NAD(P) transhydrogenase subunit alpha|nr:NAD(P) transhydrogenase subunit alpha [Clostridiaceae bacterium]